MIAALWLGSAPPSALPAGAATSRLETKSVDRASLESLPHPDLSREEDAIQQQIERSREALDSLLADPAVTDSQLAEAYGRLGRLYFVYDLNEVGPAPFRNAMRLAPDDYRWPYYLAAHQTYEGEFEEAEDLLRLVERLRPEDAPTHIRLGDLLVDRGELDEAKKHYQIARTLDPDNAGVFAGLGRVAQKEEEHELAIELIGRALELRPEANSLHHVLGLSYRALGDRERARAEMAKNKHERLKLHDPLIDALALENLSSEARFQAGNDAMRRGDMEDAAGFFEAFLQIKPDDAVARHNLGLCYLTTGRWDDGLAELRRSIELDPDFRGGHFSLASALVEDGLLEEGLIHYRRAHEIDPEEPVIHADYATLLAKLGRPDEALRELESILERDSDQDYARLKIGTVLAAIGRTDEARPVLQAAADSPSLADQNRAEALFHLGVMQLNQGDVEGARARWSQALELDPRSTDALAAMAQSLARRQEFEQAAEYFDRAATVDPRNEQLQFGRSMALILGGLHPRARQALEQGLEARPDSLALQHALARLLATSPDDQVRDGARALDLAQQVLSTRQTLDHAETLAMALAENGRFEDAVALQRQVIEQARRSGSGSGAPHERRLQRLAGYEQGQAVRAPWRDG